MKLVKSKITTALILAVLSFGTFSFTTTPINAQETNSSIVSIENMDQAAGLWTKLGKAFVKGIVYGAGLDWLVGNATEASNIPEDSLD